MSANILFDRRLGISAMWGVLSGVTIVSIRNMNDTMQFQNLRSSGSKKVLGLFCGGAWFYHEVTKLMLNMEQITIGMVFVTDVSM